MARDHRRLRVFHEAHQLVIAIYKETRDFPRDEWFGIRAQMRRAAVSTCCIASATRWFPNWNR